MAVPIDVGVNIFWKLALFFNGPLGGWSEGHCLGSADAGATISFNPVNWIELRRELLGADCTIEWVRLSRSDKKKEDFQQLTGVVGALPLNGETDVESVNMDQDGVKFRLETAGGLAVNKGIAGLRDSHIVNRVFQFPAALEDPSVLAYPASVVAVPQTALIAYKLYMQWLLNETRMPSRNPRGAATKFTLRGFKKIMFRKTFAKKLGRPFGQARGRAPALR